ncbi:MAG: dipicolinate synthase [Ruminococcaceae bacterium]|nr:dipicolinate synthase [Oscillospiraceae bacterium]
MPTAEGAIEIAMTEMPITIYGSRVLVVGYGRIGKMLASRFKSLGADVTVSARKHKDFAWIEEQGCAYIHTMDIASYIKSYDIIVNTVPFTVIDRDALSEMRKDSLIIDLASKPGGVDFTSAKELGKNVIWALSLPGKTAPITSGKIIKDTILNILTEMEVQNNGISG